MGSDWKDEDDDHKHRYYVDFEDADVVSFSDGEVLETLPDEIGK